MSADANPPKPNPTDPFEFNAEQNRLLLALASRMRFVGFFLMGLGGLAGVAGVARRDLGPLLYGLINLIVGIWTIRAGGQFEGVARTEGRDISHLMAALRELRKLYDLQYWVCLIALACLLVWLGSSQVY